MVFGRPFVKRFALCYRTVVLSVLSCPVYNVGALWQTVGWIKMKLGMQVGLGPVRIVLDVDPALPPPKGHSPHPIFGPYLLRPNGCMDQDATCCGARPEPRRRCVRWGPSSPQQPLPTFGPCLLWPNGRPSQQLLSSYWLTRRNEVSFIVID